MYFFSPRFPSQIPSPALKGVLSESQGVSNIQQTQGVPNIQRSQGVSNVQRGVFVDRFKGVSYDLEQSSNYDRLKKNVPPFRSKPGEPLCTIKILNKFKNIFFFFGGGGAQKKLKIF